MEKNLVMRTTECFDLFQDGPRGRVGARAEVLPAGAFAVPDNLRLGGHSDPLRHSFHQGKTRSAAPLNILTHISLMYNLFEGIFEKITVKETLKFELA